MAFIGNTNTTQAFTPAIDFFSGNGSTTAFTLSRPVASVAQVQVTIDNVAQNPSSAFTVSANTLTFTSAPLSGTNNVYVYYTSPITQVIAPGQGTVTATSMASSTGTGAGVFQTSPTLVTPVLGVASATSITVAAGAVGTPSITTTGDTNTGIYFPAADTIAFSEGGAEAMRIDSSGNVGIGTASPTVNLDVNSSAAGGNICAFRSTATNGGYVQFQGSGSTPTTTGYVGAASKLNTGGSVTDFGMTAKTNLVFGTNDGTERMLITSAGVISQNGNWGTNASTALRNNSAAANKFWQSGPDSNNAYIVYNQAGTGVYVVDGGTSWAGVSDERLKDIIEPITNGLNKVSTLRTVIGKFKTDAEGTRRSFLIAQDVQAVLPEAISIQDEETGTLGLSYSDVIPLLVASIKELKAINDTQAETINALTARIVALENR